MLTFETVNELTLKVTCTGSDVLFTKAGAFIAGENAGGKNYKFEKVHTCLYSAFPYNYRHERSETQDRIRNKQDYPSETA